MLATPATTEIAMTPFATLARQRALARAACCALFGAVALATHPASAATTCSGNAATETLAVSGIQAVALRGRIDVIVRQGNSESVQVRADGNVLPLVQTIVDSNGDARTLRIQFKPDESVHARVPVVVMVDVTKLNAVSSSRSGDADYGGSAVLAKPRNAGIGSVRRRQPRRARLRPGDCAGHVMPSHSGSPRQCRILWRFSTCPLPASPRFRASARRASTTPSRRAWRAPTRR
jgi:hypothetical protein